MIDNTSLIRIARQFRFEGRVERIDALGAGFINDTYKVLTAGGSPDYILQRKNHAVFPDVGSMMQNIVAVTDHLKRKVEAAGGDPLREVLTPIATLDGEYCHVDEQGNFWAATLFIDGSVTYDRASTPHLARMGGEAIGRFQTMLDDFDRPLHETIKGFHDMRHRLHQWDASLAADAAGRRRSVAREIEWIESRRDEMMRFWQMIEQGVIPRRIAHNDTKISNILFDGDGRVLCVIDLDTVMTSSSLIDFGDAIRSYTNTAAEDERDSGLVAMDFSMFEAYTEGYLFSRGSSLIDSETDNLAFAARYITYEQVLRFLMDYIDGDTYYKTAYDTHNLVRTHAQYALLRSMEQQYSRMQLCVKRGVTHRE
ncbi:MAG: aminoglycoside phosphotransferase family protein [Alistipes sp.]|nr:aminoglycoside phosphotransferase family protein [Alistipes sp.]